MSQKLRWLILDECLSCVGFEGQKKSYVNVVFKIILTDKRVLCKFQLFGQI